MAKILLINPIVRENENPMHIPYGLALLAAIAEDNGHQVQVYDHNAHRCGDHIWEEILGADDWDIIGIGGLTTTYGNIKKILRKLKSIDPKCFIVCGGGVLTSMPKDIMNWLPEIDVGFVGEAFVSFPEFLRKWDNGERDFHKMKGLAVRLNGHIIITDAAPNINNLDDLPHPAVHMFPMDIYFQNSRMLYSDEGFTSKRRIDLNGSLGCSLVCKYCWHLGITGDMVIEEDENGDNDVRFTYGRNIRYHSPEYIVNLVKKYKDELNVDFISFIDENFFTMDAHSRGTWLKELSAEWIKAGLQPSCREKGIPHDESCTGVHWGGTSHAGLHNPETLRIMCDAGCSQLVYGLETFDPKILKKLGKGSTAKRNFNSVKICLDAGITPIPNIIIGFPEETFESIRLTIDALLKLGIHCVPHFATPYPGSEWYYTYKESIIEQYNGDLEAYVLDLGDASKITAVISHNFSPAELLGLQQIVSQRNLKLLNQSELVYNRARGFNEETSDEERATGLAVPKPSFNFEKSRKSTPIESERRTSF